MLLHPSLACHSVPAKLSVPYVSQSNYPIITSLTNDARAIDGDPSNLDTGRSSNHHVLARHSKHKEPIMLPSHGRQLLHRIITGRIAVLATAITIFLGDSAAAGESSRKPNIVILLADDKEY